MPLHAALLFHFNQHLSEHALVASRTCYRGLLRVLRCHPRLKFNLHISGTLVHALNWLDPEPLDLIRSGLADGQFELLGSTYAQNVPYASDDWDNAQQIAMHRETLWEAFGVRPVGFWNPERAWRQSLAPVIVDGGYRYTLMEDHILRAAGADAPRVHATLAGPGRPLSLVWDDETLKHWVNFAAWFGQPEQALDHLRRLADQPDSQALCPAYAEDAEAMGLWGWSQGVIPNQTWANLDAFLGLIEQQSWLRLIHLSDAPAPAGELAHMPDGTAAWMNASLRRSDAPYHEDGYADWFDFLSRSPKHLHFRRLYAAARTRLQAVGRKQADPGLTGNADDRLSPSRRLYREAIRALLAHQYEFGCIGVGGKGYRGWEGAVSAFALARAAEVAEHGVSPVSIEDVNGDGGDEVLLADERRLAVISNNGARLLYWFDLAMGALLVGNHRAVARAPFKGDSKLPTFEDGPAVWLPESDEPNVAGLDSQRIEDPAPTRLGKFLPEWAWANGTTSAALYVREMRNGALVPALPAQRRALNDYITVDGGPELEPVGLMDFRVEGRDVVFIRYLPERLIMEKRFATSPDGLCVSYRFDNRTDVPRTVKLRLLSEFCPDYADVLAGGRAALEFVNGAGHGVRNTRTRTSIVLLPDRPPDSASRSDALLALETELTFGIAIPPRAVEGLTVDVSVNTS